jgi:hypothetical protein
MTHHHSTQQLVLAAALFTSGTVFAQQPPKPPYQWGDIGFTPTLTTTIAHTDNVRQNPAAVSDYRTDITFQLFTTLINTPNVTLTLDPIVLTRAYANYDSDNRTLTSVTASGEYKLNKEWSLSSNLRRFDTAVSGSDPNAIPGAISSTSTTNLGNFQINYVSPTYYDNVVVNIQKLTFASVFLPQSGTTVFRSDQDRTQTEVDNHLGRKFDWLGLNTYLYIGTNKIVYASSNASSVSGRNSSGEKVGFGIGLTPTPEITGTMLYGFQRQKYEDPALGTMEGLWTNISASWRPDPANQAALTLTRSFNETIIPGATGYFANNLLLQAQHYFSPEWSVDVSPSLLVSEVANYPAILKQHMITVGVNRSFAGGRSLRAAFMTSNQDVGNEEFASFRYRERTFSLTLTLPL